MITINFKDTYSSIITKDDLTQMTFNAPQIDGTYPN